MSRKRSGARVLGPYLDGRNYRLISIDAAGNRESVLFETEAKAERYKALLLADLSTTEHTTETAFELYKQHLRENGSKEISIKAVDYAIRRLFVQPIPLALLSTKKCEALYADLRQRPTRTTKKPPSADTHRASVKEARTFLAWCQRRGWIANNPCADVELVGRRRLRGKSLGKSGTELHVKQARAWYLKALELSEKDGVVAALIAMLLGMRASEIVNRKVGDIDTDEADCDLLWIPCSKTPAGRRTLEVPEVLRPLLVARVEGRDPSAYLFAGPDGKPHERDWVRSHVHRICDRAGVPRVTAHAMRGLLATITADRGMAGHLIAATLGHTSFAVTETHYAKPGSASAGDRRRGLVVLNGGKKAG